MMKILTRTLMAIVLLGLFGCGLFMELDDSDMISDLPSFIGDNKWEVIPNVGEIIEGQTDAEVPLGVFGDEPVPPGSIPDKLPPEVDGEEYDLDWY